MPNIYGETATKDLFGGVKGSASGNVQDRKGRKRPWDALGGDGDEDIVETGGTGNGGMTKKARRGSEPLTTAKKAKELLLKGNNALTIHSRLPTQTSPSSPEPKDKSKRAVTHSPPPSPSALTHQHPSTSAQNTINGRSFLSVPAEDFFGLSQNTVATHKGSSGVIGKVAPTKRSRSTMSDTANPRARRLGRQISSSLQEVETEDHDTIPPPNNSNIHNGMSHDRPFAIANTTDEGKTGNQPPPMRRVVSTDGYASGGRTRRETAIPKALKDYEMRIKV